jgi:hypothetical protein
LLAPLPLRRDWEQIIWGNQYDGLPIQYLFAPILMGQPLIGKR